MTTPTLKQCKSCPWRVGCVPDKDIPNYDRKLAEGLTCTLASGIESVMPVINGSAMRMMACHYSKQAAEFPCAGWLANQLGPGNNIGVRLLVASGKLPVPEIDGDQHARYEDTLPCEPPKRARKRKTSGTKKPAIEITAKATSSVIDVDAPPPPCPHPEHRLGTHGRLRKHQRVCLNCGEVILIRR